VQAGQKQILAPDALTFLAVSAMFAAVSAPKISFAASEQKNASVSSMLCTSSSSSAIKFLPAAFSSAVSSAASYFCAASFNSGQQLGAARTSFTFSTIKSRFAFAIFVSSFSSQ